MSKPLCIYHGHCDDGFAAAWAVRNTLGNEAVDFYAGQYQQAPPDVTGRNVLIVDFSYKRPVLDEMAKTAKTILILDHHKTAQDALIDAQAKHIEKLQVRLPPPRDPFPRQVREG